MVVRKNPVTVQMRLVGALKCMRRLSSEVWKIKVEDISSTTIDFLDVNLYVPNPRSGQLGLRWSLHRKVTSQRVFLHHASFHAPSVHRSWPIAEMERVGRRSSSYRFFLKDRAEHVRLFRDSFLHPDICSVCAVFAPHKHQHQKVVKQGRTTRLVLPYHPALTGLGGVLAREFDRWSGILLHFDLGNVTIAWSNACKNVVQICTTHKDGMVG